MSALASALPAAAANPLLPDLPDRSAPVPLRQAMPPSVSSVAGLYAGALAELLRHQLSGCRHAAWKAADLLERLARLPGIDDETRKLCDRMSERLAHAGGVWNRAGVI